LDHFVVVVLNAVIENLDGLGWFLGRGFVAATDHKAEQFLGPSLSLTYLIKQEF